MNKKNVANLAALTAGYQVRQSVSEAEWIRWYEQVLEDGGAPLHHGVVDGIIVASVPVRGLTTWGGRACVLW